MKRHSSLHGVFAVVTLELQCYKGILDKRLAEMAKIRILGIPKVRAYQPVAADRLLVQKICQ